MKLTLKLFITLAIIACASTKALRSETEQDGSGTWDAGYKCPQLYFNEEGKPEENNGEVLILADQLVKQSTKEDKFGLVLQLTNAPKATLKNNVVAFGKKLYLPWRNFSTSDKGKAKYENPFAGSKTITATINGDDGKSYILKIVLPYKHIGWIINDDQGTKIEVAINNNANSMISAVKNSKTAIVNMTHNLIATFKSMENFKISKINAIEKNNKLLQGFVTEKKKNEENLKKIKLEFNIKAIEFNNLKIKMNMAQNHINAINSQIDNGQQTLKSLEGKTGNAMSLFEDKNKELSKELKLKFATLKIQAANRKADVTSAEAASTALKFPGVESNLNKFVPNSTS